MCSSDLCLGFHLLTINSGSYLILNSIGDAIFFFLPIILGFTAAKKLGSNPVNIAVVGAVLTYPNIIKAASQVATAHISFFGIPTTLVSYTAS
ncbi:PTS transporter subunit EIIC, partial [Staphylococcus epidermidis]|uniref:PTS transporter subunit EIIC n=1 Tax=Staphylococcus epidermidis TaxID=1282 RepID=UPI003C7E5862